MKMSDAPRFYFIFKQEIITAMQNPPVEIERPRCVPRIITPSAERKLEVQLIQVKNISKSLKKKPLYKIIRQALTQFNSVRMHIDEKREQKSNLPFW